MRPSLRFIACLLLVSVVGTSSARAAGIQAETHANEQRVSFALGDAGILVVDDGAPAAERVLATLPLAAPLFDLLFIDNRLYVARGPAGITVIDVSDHMRPVELFSFGSNHAPIKLSRQGSSLVAVDDRGNKVAYDLSRRDTPRLVPPPQPPAPPGERAAFASFHPADDPPRDVAVRFIAAGSSLLASSLIVAAVGALLFAASDQAIAQDRQRQQERQAACKQRMESVCGWFYFSLAGLPELAAGYIVVGHAVLRSAVSIPILAVGLHKLRRSATVRPVVAFLPGAPATTPGVLVGANLGLRF